MLALLLAITSPLAPQQTPPAASPRPISAWRAHLAPTQHELRWRSIPWRPTLGEGLEAAARSGRPLLLWLMNGHPLGCT